MVTVIVLLILAGVAINLVVDDGIINNATNAVEKSNIATWKEKIEHSISRTIISSDRDIDIEEIISQLEKDEIILDSNSDIGQVKTEDGYIYEIKEDKNGNWDVEYIGKGDLAKTELIITLTPNTVGLTNKVTISIVAKADSGIKSYAPQGGATKTYASGTKQISETYEVSSNGTYTFTITNNNGKTESKTITISNILEGTIGITTNLKEGEWTNKEVTVTITWPTGSNKGIKEIKVGEGIWQTVEGETSTVTTAQNTTIRARISNSSTEILSNSITINKIDKLAPNTFTLSATATQNSITISGSTTDQTATSTNGSSGIKGYYFSIDNGATWQSNGVLTNGSYTYTGLAQGTTYILKMKAVDKAGNETISSQTVTTEKLELVYANLYKISDTEYHLIYNSTGNVTSGYNESDRVWQEECTNGYSSSKSVYWANNKEGESYIKDLVNTCIIEDNIIPKSTSYYFYKLDKITEIKNLENIDTSQVTDMSYMFYYCNSLTSIDVSGFDTKKVINMSYMFGTDYEWWNDDIYSHSKLESLDVSNFDTRQVTNMSNMFEGCEKLTSLNVSNFNTKNVTNMSSMFEACGKLTSLDVSNFDTKNVINMSYMFSDCYSLISIDVSGFDTSKVTDISDMFYQCERLTDIDVSGFDTKNVTNMEKMFVSCESLTSLNVTNFDTSKVTNMYRMFSYCENLTGIDVSNFDTSQVTDMEEMFGFCYKLISLDLSNFDTSRVGTMLDMFHGCKSLTTIYVSDLWKTDQLESGLWYDDMFSGCTALKGAISYDSSKADVTYANYTNGYLTYKAR